MFFKVGGDASHESHRGEGGFAYRMLRKNVNIVFQVQ